MSQSGQTRPCADGGGGPLTGIRQPRLLIAVVIVVALVRLVLWRVESSQDADKLATPEPIPASLAIRTRIDTAIGIGGQVDEVCQMLSEYPSDAARDSDEAKRVALGALDYMVEVKNPLSRDVAEVTCPELFDASG